MAGGTVMKREEPEAITPSGHRYKSGAAVGEEKPAQMRTDTAVRSGQQNRAEQDQQQSDGKSRRLQQITDQYGHAVLPHGKEQTERYDQMMFPLCSSVKNKSGTSFTVRPPARHQTGGREKPSAVIRRPDLRGSWPD